MNNKFNFKLVLLIILSLSITQAGDTRVADFFSSEGFTFFKETTQWLSQGKSGTDNLQKQQCNDYYFLQVDSEISGRVSHLPKHSSLTVTFKLYFDQEIQTDVVIKIDKKDEHIINISELDSIKQDELETCVVEKQNKALFIKEIVYNIPHNKNRFDLAISQQATFFGISDLEVVLLFDEDQSWEFTAFDSENFSKDDLDGWESSYYGVLEKNECGDQNYLLGGYRQFIGETQLEKRFTFLAAHITVFLKMDLYIFDFQENVSLDIIVDGVTHKKLNFETASPRYLAPCGDPKKLNILYNLDIAFQHQERDLTLVIKPENFDKSNSWGVSNFKLCLDQECKYEYKCDHNQYPYQFGQCLLRVEQEKCVYRVNQYNSKFENSKLDDIISSKWTYRYDSYGFPVFQALITFNSETALEKCFKKEIVLHETILPEETEEEFFLQDNLKRRPNYWLEDPQGGTIGFEVYMKDLVKKYGCTEVVLGSKITFFCDAHIYLHSIELPETIVYSFSFYAVLNNQKKVIQINEGEDNKEQRCCKNELNIKTKLRVCEDRSCQNFIDLEKDESYVQVKNMEEITLEHKIASTLYKGFHLNPALFTVNKKVPKILDYDTTERGVSRITFKVKESFGQFLDIDVVSLVEKNGAQMNKNQYDHNLRNLGFEEDFIDLRENYDIKSQIRIQVNWVHSTREVIQKDYLMIVVIILLIFILVALIFGANKYYDIKKEEIFHRQQEQLEFEKDQSNQRSQITAKPGDNEEISAAQVAAGAGGFSNDVKVQYAIDDDEKQQQKPFDAEGNQIDALRNQQQDTDTEVIEFTDQPLESSHRQKFVVKK